MDGTKEKEDDGNIQVDPFMQPPILKVLFEQMPIKELLKCRLVSKLWCSESLSTWRSNATLKFNDEWIVSTRDDRSKRTISIGEFLTLWEAGEWSSCPFRKFKLANWDFQDVEHERFLEMIGGHITSLTLDWCSFLGRDNFQRIIYQAFPKLQFLKMEGCKAEDDDDDSDDDDDPTEELTLAYKEPTFGVHGLKSLHISDCHPHSMMDMLSHFHKIKSLTIEPKELEYRNLLEVIRLIRAQDRTKLPLKNFDVDFDLYLGGQSTASSIELLKPHEQLHLPLQRLKIYFDGDPNEDCNFNEFIRDILQHHCSTLTGLDFSENGGQQLWKSFSFGFCLENLEELRIRTFQCWDNLNFLMYTPNLGGLEIENISLSMSESEDLFSNSSKLEIGGWTLLKLKDLAIRLPLSVCNLGKLMKRMPNVERLGLELDDVKLAMICNNWKNLKYLEDWGCELTDAGVIGIGIGNIHEYGGDEGSPSWPNITKLKKLQFFVTSSSKLTSASVRDGFLKLANLKWITLGHSTKFDDEAKAALERRKITLHISDIN